MITVDYCVTMARYNAWQNRQLKLAFARLDETALHAERGAFFGSIFGTANHLLWGDTRWLSLLTGSPGPELPGSDSVRMTRTLGDWEIARFRTDAALLDWANRLRSVDLTGPLSWHSGILGREVSKPRGLCIAHMFNQQTHHRGQIHAMLTAAGVEAPVTDVIFMPDDGPWL